jgi:hypothetical protein
MADGVAHRFEYSKLLTGRVNLDVKPSISGLPRASSEDDVYKGFFIPKGLFRLIGRFVMLTHMSQKDP